MSRLQANFLLLLAAAIWGTTFVVQQVGLGNLGPLSFTAARFLLGALLVFPLALRQYRRVTREVRPLETGDLVWLLVTGATLFTAAALQQIGILGTTVTHSGLLTALYVPLVPLLALMVLRRRIQRASWPASLACLFGTYLLNGAQPWGWRSGDLWVLGSTLFWAIHVLLIEYVTRRIQAPMVVAGVQFLVCGSLGLVTGFLTESPASADFLDAMSAILYAGLLSVGLGFSLQVVGQQYTRAPDAAILLSSETLFAALSGFVFLGETLAIPELGGAILILAGILTVQLLSSSELSGARESPQATAESPPA